MNAAYPVHYHVTRPAEFRRLELLIRIVAFMALGMVGLSFGGFFAFAYLALPVYAAVRAGSGGPGFSDADRGRVVLALHWVAAVCAWVGLTSDRVPSSHPSETVRLRLDAGGGAEPPSPRSAILRVVTGLPSLFGLMFVGFFGGLAWIWAAITVLASERVSPTAFEVLVGVQRWSIRLLAYQASLVDEYPPFGFADTAASADAGADAWGSIS